MNSAENLAQALHALLGASAFLTLKPDGRGYFDSGADVNRFRQAVADGWRTLDTPAQPAQSLGHAYDPNKRYPWFCRICGYAEHEPWHRLPQG